MPGSSLLYGLIWGVALWIMAVVVEMPMVGAGFLMTNIGVMIAVIPSLMAHLVYGALLGSIAGDGSEIQTA